MKKFVLSITITLFSTIALWALDASISYATFKSTTGNYIEVYLNIVGQTVAFVPLTEPGKPPANRDVVCLFKRGDTVITS